MKNAHRLEFICRAVSRPALLAAPGGDTDAWYQRGGDGIKGKISVLRLLLRLMKLTH